MKNSLLFRVLGVLAVYIVLKYFGGSFGEKVLYPVNLLVTFLHEFGHALGTWITGGEVVSIEINHDGSGKTLSRGGWRSVILMGGYIGSAVLGNLLFYIGARWDRWAGAAVIAVAALMVFVGVIFTASGFTTTFLVLFAIGLYLVSRYTGLDREILMFLGLASILYIIQDFDVASSDLKEYARVMVIFPLVVWKYTWLGIALLLCVFNLRMIFRSSPKVEKIQD